VTGFQARDMARVSATVWGVTIWQAALGLITTPFLVRHLGPPEYGIFALITIISMYLSNLELGFGHATLQFVARARAAGDDAEEAHVLTTSFAVFAVAGITATSIALFASSFIADHFVHGAARGTVALDAIRLGALTLLGSLLASFAAVSLQGLNRYGTVIRARFISGTLSSAGSIVAVLVGGGLRAVLIVQVALNAGLAVTLLVRLARSTSSRLVPRAHRRTFVAMARYGIAVLVAGLAYQVLLQGPPTILAGNTTTDQVAAYAVPSMVMQQLVILLGSASFAFAPFASAQSISTDRTRLAEIFRANVRITLLVAGPIVAFLVLLGKPLLVAWIGASFADNAVGPLRFLSIAALALALSAPPADVLRGVGKPTSVAWFTIASAAIAVGGSFALVESHGAEGVAAALAISLVVATSVLIVVVAERALGITPKEFVYALAGPVVAAGLAAGSFAVGADLTSGFGGAIATGMIGSSIYAVVVFRWILDDRERSVLAGLRPPRRQPPARNPV
jgi:O-antigen/teichoic acid export membrane protein